MFNERMLKQCIYVKFKGTMTKWPVQTSTHRTTQKHVENHDATDILKEKWILQKMLSYRFCTVNDFH